MTDHNTSDPLNRLLRGWAEEHAPTAADVDLLTTRIMQATEAEPEAESWLDSPTDLSPTLPATQSWFGPVAALAVVAAAVIVLVVATMWRTGTHSASIPAVAKTREVPPPAAWLPDDQLRAKAVLLHEMESIYGCQLNWLAETDQRVQFDIEQRVTARDDQVVAVRVVVQRRQLGRTQWELAWEIDVVARNEEVVRLVPETAGMPQLEMWAYALPDGMIALDTDVQLDGSALVRSVTTVLQPDGRPQEVLTARAANVEFRVYHTVAFLNDRLS